MGSKFRSRHYVRRLTGCALLALGIALLGSNGLMGQASSVLAPHPVAAATDTTNLLPSTLPKPSLPAAATASASAATTSSAAQPRVAKPVQPAHPVHPSIAHSTQAQAAATLQLPLPGTSQPTIPQPGIVQPGVRTAESAVQSLAQAATNYPYDATPCTVNTTADDDTPTASTDYTNTTGTLRTYIQNGGWYNDGTTTYNENCSTIDFTTTEVVALTGLYPLVIPTGMSVTINGDGSTIEGVGLTNHAVYADFVVEPGASLTLHDLTITGGTDSASSTLAIWTSPAPRSTAIPASMPAANTPLVAPSTTRPESAQRR